MTTTQISPEVFHNRKQLNALNKIVVAHDFSIAADRALSGAIAISKQFHSEVVLAHVEAETDTSKSGSQQHEKKVNASMDSLRRRIELTGYPCKEVMRSGDAATMLSKIVEEEKADLLLLGAYGHGSKERTTLGVTAEELLRSISCPVLVYGPKATKTLFQFNGTASILVPIELPCPPQYLGFAVSVAKLFHAKLEVLHVVDMERAISMPHAYQDMQYTCEEIASFLRTGGVHVAASLLFGKPDTAILTRSHELQNSMILMPLETRGRLSSNVSDNVAAGVIRKAEVPVMTYRIDL